MRQFQLGAAALAAIAVLAACGNDSDAAESGRAGAGPTATPPDYQTMPEESGPIEPGRWAVEAEGPDDAPLAVIDVPGGLYGGGPNIWSNKAVIGYWTVDGVYRDPCSRIGAATPVGDSVDQLAAALAAQEVTTTTRAEPVSIGGHDGLYLELSTPKGSDVDSCPEDGLLFWGDGPAFGASDVLRNWILDVDGQRVMIFLGGPANATDETVRLFTGIVEGATFVEGG
jgi:hypothetical protein